MEIAIISDLHGNLEGLQAVVNDIKERKLKEVVCLGDLVGYGANPNECIEIVADLARIVIAGNHDWAVIDKTDYSNFNPVARIAIEWTKKNTKNKNLEYLNSLGLTATIKANSLFFVHSTPHRPEEWNYLFDPIDFEEQFAYFKEKICFVGHSHEPVFASLKGSKVEIENENPLKITNHFRYIINVGSVGQPRDLDPRASYAILDTKKSTVEIVRLQYDIALAQKKIIDAGLPEFLALRLARGQ